MRQISLETSKSELHQAHKIVDGDGRKKSVTISKRLLSSLLVDHHRMVAYLGPLVENVEDLSKQNKKVIDPCACLC